MLPMVPLTVLAGCAGELPPLDPLLDLLLVLPLCLLLLLEEEELLVLLLLLL